MSILWEGALVVCLAGALVLPVAAQDADATADRRGLSSTRETLQKWVETQELIAGERREWENTREVLEQRINLLRGEIAEVEERIAETRSSMGESDVRRQELITEKRQLTEAAESLEAAIGPLEQRTRELLARAPDPLTARVAPLAQRLPNDPATTKLSLSERYQNVIGILNEVGKFNQDVHVTSEVRPMEDGTTQEVDALYVGLGQAFYVTKNRESAGVGRPTAEGWEWEARPEIANEVALAIAILKNEKVPSYVPLPVEIR
jgi:phage shock protein A